MNDHHAEARYRTRIQHRDMLIHAISHELGVLVSVTQRRRLLTDDHAEADMLDQLLSILLPMDKEVAELLTDRAVTPTTSPCTDMRRAT